MSGLVWGGVLLAGGLGAVLRFLVDGETSRRISGSAPYGTLVVNLSGALLLGLLSGLALPTDVALLLGTGILGAYTTFSTWVFETHRLIEERQSAIALGNIVVSVLAGVAAAAVGLWIGGRL
jgi:CrcB protein